MRRFTTLKDEIEHRKSIYGQILPGNKPSIAVIQKSNRVTQYANETTSMTHRIHQSINERPMNRILSNRFVKNTEKHEKEYLHHKDIHNLKTAFSEYYLMLVLLQKYQLLNFTGFIKILKKHDKLFQTTRGDEWR